MFIKQYNETITCLKSKDTAPVTFPVLRFICIESGCVGVLSNFYFTVDDVPVSK